MKLGFIGLGRMGKAMVLNFLEKGVNVVAYNRTKQKVDELSAQIENLKLKTENCGEFYKVYTVKDLIKQLNSPRIIWLMVPHGDPVDQVIDQLIDRRNPMVQVQNNPRGYKRNSRDYQRNRSTSVEQVDTLGKLTPGDIIIDGGNSFYKNSVRRYKSLKKKGVHFLDVGTSGGLEGARNGACMMVGGDDEIYKKVEPILKKIAIGGGLSYFGPSGAGHFVKMVHNGVEYGILQALGEGFEILEKSHYEIDFEKVARNWSNGSVIRGWLIELLQKAFKDDPYLSKIEGVIGGGSTGKWTVKTAKELGVETPVIIDSLKAREKSQKKTTFSGKVVAALRNQFGGHKLKFKI